MIKRKKERKKENSHKNKLIEDSSEKVNKYFCLKNIVTLKILYYINLSVKLKKNFFVH